MAQEGGQERTEEATAKRLRESREKGQIARSRELTSVVMLLAGGGILLALGDGLITALLAQMRTYFQPFSAGINDVNQLPGVFLAAAVEALWLLLPVMAVLALAAVLASVALGGWAFSAQAMAFKWERLDPIKGLGKVFAWRGVVELLKALVKFVLVGGVALALLAANAQAFLALGTGSVAVGLREAAGLLIWGFLLVSASLILVALVDVPFQLWDHAKQLRMTRQEVKDENKETEGSPEVRNRVRALQREMAQRRMMADVPRADVVITNPTHFAVALRYDQSTMPAPKVVAKGADLVAAQLRTVAAGAGVPIVSAPSLARAIYYSTDINRDIPAGLYLAVAQVLAYVYQLRHTRGRKPAAPQFADLPIPDELRRER
ncbi:MAG TPA: flagellar biosynthesis protein FlhB [Gammaproteobacteria bacterium]|nr:flagellar biosynthesis protein FlhB [Gammaproteobacteria bacterium]